MKIIKLLCFSLLCLMALSVNAQRCAVLEFKAGVGISQNDVDDINVVMGQYNVDIRVISVPQGYVDLGLPSGTIWKDKNESGFYDYDAAVRSFGSKLPTKEQLEELINSCTWSWTGSGYKVTGPNGQSITLPAAGLRGCDGGENLVGTYGRYWSSTPGGSEHAWALLFGSSGVDMYNFTRCTGLSVRLVQD